MICFIEFYCCFISCEFEFIRISTRPTDFILTIITIITFHDEVDAVVLTVHSLVQDNIVGPETHFLYNLLHLEENVFAEIIEQGPLVDNLGVRF